MSLFPADWVQHVIRAPLDVPYYYGGKIGPFPNPAINAPNGNAGYDCSGYSQACMRLLGKIGHGVDWMSASGMYDACTKISASEVQAGDLAFYAYEGRLCHVVVCAGPVGANGLAPIIGANGGGSSTHGDDPDAYVKYDEDYWASGLVGYGRYDMYGVTTDDLLICIALWLAWGRGYTSVDHFPSSPEGWTMIREIFDSRDPVDYTGTLTIGQVYQPFLLLNEGNGTVWQDIADSAAATWNTLTTAAEDAWDWVTGDEEATVDSGDASGYASTQPTSEETATTDETSWWDWWTGADQPQEAEAVDDDESSDGWFDGWI